MRILLINDYAVPSYGSENQVLALRDALIQKGHDARIFAGRVGPGGKRGGLADYHCRGTRSHLQTLVKVANLWAFVKLRQVLGEFRPQVVHVRMFLPQLSPLILPLLKNIPTLYLAAAHTSICPMGNKLLPDGTLCEQIAGTVCYRRGCLPLRSWLPQMIELKLFQHWKDAFDMIIANSRALQSQLACGGLQSDAVLWNFVSWRKQRPPLTAPPTAVFAGRLIHEKGADILVKAFQSVRRALPDARLIIAGDGPQRVHLQKLISTMALNYAVTLTGHLTRDRLEALFDRAWVQVVPGRWAEPFGNVAAEALMRGTAVIASASGAMPEIIADGQSGLLVPPGDVHHLAQKMTELLADRKLAEEMGRRARIAALKHFSQETYLDTLLAIYQTIRCKYRHSH